MSKVRINDLARELEVKSREILDVLAELGLAVGKTHSSSLDEDESAKVRGRFERGGRPSGHAGSSASRSANAPAIAPKIDLSRISKPGDALKAVLAKKKEEEEEARRSHLPQKPPAAVPAKPATERPAAEAAPAPPAAPARPEPRKIVPSVRPPAVVGSPVVAPPAPPAIASRPPVGPVVAKAPAGAVAPRQHVVAAPPVVVVKPPTMPREADKPAVAVRPPAESVSVAPPAPVAEPPAHVSEPATQPAHVSVSAAAATVPEPLDETTLTPGTVETPARRRGQAPPAVPAQPPAPARRMVMPQTGPRPVYRASVMPTPPAGSAAGATGSFSLQRGKPIFDRRPGGGYPQRASGPGAPGQLAGGPRPKHPTRSAPSGFAPSGAPGGPGGRPGFGARPGVGARPGFGPRPGAGGAPATGEAPRPQRAPAGR
ncbi:MAG: translation initiation factor IF-2 N-terminal domain-containing protein, partial [Terracidiphilus sp.]